MTDIRIVRAPILLSDVIAIAERRFGDMTKAVVDVSRGVVIDPAESGDA